MVISGTKIRDLESKNTMRSRFRKNPDLELALRGLRSRERYQTPDLHLREKKLQTQRLISQEIEKLQTWGLRMGRRERDRERHSCSSEM